MNSENPKSQLQTSNSAWVDLCAESELPARGGHYVVHAGRPLAVFRAGDGTIHVLDDACPHAGGSLSAGHVQDGCAVCPVHGWTFTLSDGRCPDNPAIAVRTYEACVSAGRVRVKMGKEVRG